MSVYRDCLQHLRPYIPGRPISAVKRRYGLEAVVKLASNENPFGCSPKVREAVAHTFAETQIYPNGYCTDLREALCEKFNLQPGQLVFGAGTDEVIAMLGKVFINPGDECVTAAVTFSQYASAVESMGGRMVYAPMGENHTCDMRTLLNYISDKTKMIFIANPNNPTGIYNTAEEQEALMAAVPSHITVVFDEAYQEYVIAPDYPDTWETLMKYDNAVLLKTFSKIYGLASLRVGYGAMKPETASEIEKIRCPFNVSAQAQAAALASLQDTDFAVRSSLENRLVMDSTVKALTEMGIFCLPSQANFIAADIGPPSTQTFEKLMSKGYIVRSGLALGLPDGFQRITLGSEAQMEGFIRVLKHILEK